MLENFRNVFNFGTKKFLGIDIGTSSIRIIELAKKRNIISLNNYAEVKSSSFVKKPFRVFTKNSVSLSNTELGEAIKTIMSEAGIETKQANLGIPDFSSFFTSFQIPVMSREEIPQAIQYEVRPYIPLPLLEVTPGGRRTRKPMGSRLPAQTMHRSEHRGGFVNAGRGPCPAARRRRPRHLEQLAGLRSARSNESRKQASAARVLGYRYGGCGPRPVLH